MVDEMGADIISPAFSARGRDKKSLHVFVGVLYVSSSMTVNRLLVGMAGRFIGTKIVHGRDCTVSLTLDFDLRQSRLCRSSYSVMAALILYNSDVSSSIAIDFARASR